ncbi:Cadherin domain protein [Stieleria maiorica]|uniref:Cadherin domain protein n=1 Tax=Stieleria maiorica TaxID=2795974 RepID=A0A5B9MA58_9BACT|nr:Cadherin domain protein [Stieleria maiorica]
MFDFYLLEDRILLSADGFDAADSAPHADVELLDAIMAQLLASDSAASADPLIGIDHFDSNVTDDTADSTGLIEPAAYDPSRRLEVVFVDAGVEDADVLLAGLRDSAADGTQWSIVRLSSDEDGIAQITRALDQLSGVDAVHLLSHASGEGIQLGNTRLDMNSATAHAGSIARWAGALDADADLLIYGCDLASSDSGRDLIETLAAVCDCDVAASDDLTGHQTLGGDWELEYAVGTIETQIAFESDATHSWQHVFATVDVTFQEGVNGYTGTQDTDFNGDSPNSSYGNDASIAVDDDHNNGFASVGLLRFDSIFGNGPGQIPLGSTIVSASLTINGVGAGTAGGTLSLHEMLTAWDESSTYNSLGSGLQAGTEYVAAADGSITDLSSLGLYTITGLEDALQTWSDGGTNYGWALFNDNANGFDFDSSEEANASLRPELSIQYIAPNSAPVLTASSPNGLFTENGAPIYDAYATVTDSDSADFDGGDLTVTITTNATANDRLEIRNVGTGPGQISTSGSNVYYEGNLIGTFSGGVGTTALTVNLNANADVTAVQGLARAIAFNNVSENPSTATRIISAVLSDGDGGTSAASNINMYISAVNDAPVAADDNYSVDEEVALSVDWFDTAWTARQTLTFDNSGQTEALTDFPVLVVLNSGNIDYAKTQDDGADLRFFDSDGTALAYEIEEWNESGDSYVWVRVPQIDASSSSDGITMYYGNASATAGQDPTAVWNGDYTLVHHLQETSGTHLDSTSNGLSAVNTGSDQNATGLVSGANNLDGNDYLTVAHDASLDVGGEITVSALIYANAGGMSGWDLVLNKGTTGSNQTYFFGLNGDEVSFGLRNGADWPDVESAVNLTTETWYAIAATFNDATDEVKLYVDGVEVATGTITQSMVNNTDDLTIGNSQYGEYFDGIIDEVRIYNTVQSADWIAAQSLSMRNDLGSEFVSFGGEQSVPATGGVLVNDSDADGDAVTVSLVAGPSNAASFTLRPDGTFNYTPIGDFSGVDTFTYKTNDGTTDSNVATVTITVNPVNDDPIITSDGGGASAAVNVFENGVYVSTVTATDADLPADTLTYSISGGLDAAKFTIDSSTGVLEFVSASDFESPTDNGGDNVYDVIVQVSDGTSTDSQSIAVTVTDVADGGQYLDLFDADAYNNSDGTQTWSDTWVDSEDGNATIGSIKVSGGELRVIANNVNDSIYRQVDLSTATSAALDFSFDNDLTGDRTILVQVSGDGGLNYDTLATLDAATNTGTGTLSFDISAYTAADTRVRFIVTAIGGGGPGGNVQLDNVQISYTPNSPPTITSDGAGATASVNVAENGTAVTTVTATDGDAQTLTYSIIGGADSTKFAIDPNSGALTFASAPDFESPTDSGGNNVYDVTVQVSDGITTDTQAVAVTVTDVNESPSVATNTGATVLEGSTGNAITTAMLNEGDVDDSGAGLTYTITDVTDNGTMYLAGFGALGLNDTFTQADIDAGDVTYDHDGSETTSDAFSFSLADGGENGATAATGTFNFTVTAVNDAPAEASIEGAALAYTENGGPVAITSTLALSDSDDTNLESAVVQITGNYANGQDVLTFVDQNGISGVWNAGSGTLTLTGTATVAQYQAALRSITYTNTSDNPSTATRTVSFTVNDGDVDSNTQTRDISIAATNDDPTGTGLPSDITVTEDVSSNVDLSALNLSDVDANSGNLTVTLSTSTGGNLSAIPGGGVTVGGSGTGTLTLTGTLSDLNTFLDAPANVQYLHGTPHTFGNDADTIQVVINDGGNTGSGGGTDQTVGTVNVDITAVNDEQVLATNTGDTVAEGSTGNTVTTAMLETTDVDNTDSQLVYTVDAVPTNGTLYRNGVALNVSDTFTQADIDAGLISYDHDGSDTVSDSFDFTVDDGVGTTTSSTFNWTVTAGNDAPIEASTEGTTLAYTENDGAVAITSTLALSDSDDTNLESAVVQITGNYANGQDVLTFVDQTGISGVWNAGSGTLTLTGTATVAQYQAALRSITYTNTSDNPSTATRTVSFTVNDGDVDSNTQTRDISIAATNDDPTGTGLPSDIAVTEDVSSNVDLSALNLNDVDANSGNLTVTLSTSTGGNLSASSGGGVTVGGSGSGTLTLTGTLSDLNTFLDTPANVQYLHGTPHTFGNDADTIQVVVNDGGNTGSGGGTDQTVGTVNVDITAVNDEQVLAANTGDTVTEGSTGNTVTTAMLETTDVDNTDSQLVYTVDAVPTNGTLYRNGVALNVSDTFTQADIDAGLISYDHDGSNTTSDSFDFTVDDGAGTTTSSTFNWTVTAANDAPVEASIEGTTLAYTENDGAVVITSTLALSDSDDTNLESAIVQITGNYANGQDVLAFVDQNGISGVWNAGSGTLTLTGTATVAQYQAALRSITYTNTSDNPSTATRTVSFTVNDGDVDSNTQTRNISIAATNDDPAGTGLPSDITVTEDVSSNVDLSALNLSDVDANSGNLTVTLSTSTGGNLSASSGGGVTVGGNGTGTLTLTGTLTDLNTFLDTPANVQYLHGTPHTFGDDADTIQVVVNDGGNTGSGGGTDQTIGTVNVDITAVNDEQVLATNTGDTVTEGSTGNTVTTAMLETTDVDNTDSQLVYTVDTVPTNGTLYRNGVALNVSDTFTQADIDAGLISYDHDGSNTTSDSFDFTVDDGVGTTTSSTFNWTVTASNAAPVATGESFTVNIGETLTVGVSSVIFNDSDVDGDSLAIVLVAAPTNGSFTLDPGGNFTYTPNPGFFGQDSFLYQVTDGTLLSNVAEAVLEVPLALLATSGTTETSSETEPEPEPETEDFTEPESDPPSEIESQGEESTDPSDATETTSPAGDVVPAVVMDGSGDKAGGDANRTSGAGNGGDDTGLPNEVMALEAERQLYGIYAASEEASSLTMGYSPELQQLERLLRQDLQQAIVWTQWDEAPEDDENQMTVMVGAAGAGMSVFSIGYVFWALRGGTLMTVFASSLPAWRFIDPIAMLSAYRSSKPGFDEGLDGLIK